MPDLPSPSQKTLFLPERASSFTQGNQPRQLFHHFFPSPSPWVSMAASIQQHLPLLSTDVFSFVCEHIETSNHLKNVPQHLFHYLQSYFYVLSTVTLLKSVSIQAVSFPENSVFPPPHALKKLYFQRLPRKCLKIND